ncbi:MAG: helix-turn-helix domain-containing protein [Erysipelotrichaceae bacterium]|jgi:transcriptional regulator with XRE-family HTH domain|nr:helix-turn-helix domain-containing protein [Erysipelotrichaceae bacterium]
MKHLKTAIDNANLSYSALARDIGVSRSTFWGWLNGIHDIPATKLFKLSEILSLPMEYLLNGNSRGSTLELTIRKMEKLELQKHEAISAIENVLKQLKS